MYPVNGQLQVIDNYNGIQSPLNQKEQNYLNQLMQIPYETFRFSYGFDGCKIKALGQKIYDDFNSENKGVRNVDAGKAALKKIADALLLYGEEGRGRRLHLDVIWQGVGDFYWKWNFLYDGYRPEKKGSPKDHT